MCGRLGRYDGQYHVPEFTPGSLELVANFDRIAASFTPTYNMAPGRDQCVIVQNREGKIEPRLMHWGLIRPWSTPTTPKPSNARAESILDKPMFRDLVATRRCLVPAGNYYEWKREGAGSVPYLIHTTDQRIFHIAAIYDAWRDNRGQIVASYCMITTTPAESIAHIHNRMPVIIEPRDYALWLSREVRDLDQLRPLLRPYPSERLEYWPVSNRINSVANDDADLCIPIDQIRQPALLEV